MRLELAALATALFGGACSAQISDGSRSQFAGVDGGGTTDPIIDAPTAPKCAMRSVYLNFEGQTLTQGSMGASDATMNIAGWMQQASGTAPAYLAGNANRATAIQTIVDGVTAQLSQFPITVVTTRPTSGNYMMIVFGGQAQQVGSAYGGAVDRLDCGDQYPNDVAWISDGVSPSQHVINNVLGAIGFGLGLTATNDPKDCMCGWANNCQSINTAACTLGSSIARDTAAIQKCSGAAAIQDEVAALQTAFCGP